MVNQKLQDLQVSTQQHFQNYYDEDAHRLVTETLSKIKGLKVKDGKKEEKMPEVD